MSIQARISAFEALSTKSIDFLESPPPSAMATASLQPVIPPPRPSPSPSPPNLGRKSSLLDLKDWVVDDGLFSPSKPPSFNGHIDKPLTQLKLANKRLPRDSSTTTATSEIPRGTPNVPLIDLSSPPKPKPKTKPKPANLSGAPTAKSAAFAAAAVTTASENNVNGKGPPKLPPRKSSQTSLRSAAATDTNLQLNFLYPPRRQDSLSVDHTLEPHSRSSSHGPSSSISSFHSVSLSSDTDTSTPSGSVSNFIATFPIDRERSASSADIDSVSLSGSYEEVSTSSLASPATIEKIEWLYATRKPPKLPERPSPTVKPLPGPATRNTPGSVPSSPVIRPSLSRHSSITTLNTAPPYSPYTPRRAAPPPPPSRSSDRSSILSSTSFSSHSSHSLSYQLPVPGAAPNVTLKTKRPTPVPLTARKRYETVFVKNIIQRKTMQNAKKNEEPSSMLTPLEAPRNRRAAGWRGLSMDLIVGDDGLPVTNGKQQQKSETSKVDETVGNDEKLEGEIVKLIWKKSGLETSRLIEIWNECDPTGQGALNLDSFVKGMWRIDEELRRTQAQLLKTANAGLGAYRGSNRNGFAVAVSVAPRLPPRGKDVLR